MIRNISLSLVLAAVFLFSGCQQTQDNDEAAATQPDLHAIDRMFTSRSGDSDYVRPELVQAYRLFHDLVKDLRRAELILSFKGAGEQREALIRQISKDARADLETLKAYFKTNSKAWGEDGLPEAEQAVRKDIASLTSKRLIFARKTFGRDLMISHISAMEYAVSLLRVMQKYEQNIEQKKWLKSRALVYKKIYEDLKTQLVVKPTASK